MALLATQAIGQEIRYYSSGKRKNIPKIMLRFPCRECQKFIFVPKSRNPLEKSTGRCRQCANSYQSRVRRGVTVNRKRPFEWTYNKLCFLAEKRNIPVLISYEDFLSFTSERECHYCGRELVWLAHATGKQTSGINIDRKDSAAGYEKSNMVVCCGQCNWIKSVRLSYEEMLLLGPVLREIRIRRDENVE